MSLLFRYFFALYYTYVYIHAFARFLPFVKSCNLVAES